ncbi:hypothetical protein MHEI_37100 [Mycobacterium heidelbergense]|nr:hypothetical protein MHEI_37100 [Mycobacterium heidelbergense]
MEANVEGAVPAASPLWLVPREYCSGGAKWLSRAIHDLSREIHPILAEFGRTTVIDLPEVHPTDTNKIDDAGRGA